MNIHYCIFYIKYINSVISVYFCGCYVYTEVPIVFAKDKLITAAEPSEGSGEVSGSSTNMSAATPSGGTSNATAVKRRCSAESSSDTAAAVFTPSPPAPPKQARKTVLGKDFFLIMIMWCVVIVMFIKIYFTFEPDLQNNM